MKYTLLAALLFLLLGCGGGALNTSPFPEETAFSVTDFTPAPEELDSLLANGNCRGFRTYEFQWKRGDSLELINTNNRSVKIYKNSVNVYPGEKVLFRTTYNVNEPLIPVKNPVEGEEYIEIRLEQAKATKEMYFTIVNKQNQGIKFHMLINPDVNKTYYKQQSCPLNMQSEKMMRWEYPSRSVMLYGFELADPLRDDCWD